MTSVSATRKLRIFIKETLFSFLKILHTKKSIVMFYRVTTVLVVADIRVTDNLGLIGGITIFSRCSTSQKCAVFWKRSITEDF